MGLFLSLDENSIQPSSTHKHKYNPYNLPYDLPERSDLVKKIIADHSRTVGISSPNLLI